MHESLSRVVTEVFPSTPKEGTTSFSFETIPYNDRKTFSFVQYMEFTHALHKVSQFLNYIFFQWYTSDYFDYKPHVVDTSSAKHIKFILGWYDIISFDTIHLHSHAHALRSKYGIFLFNEEFPWPSKLFYINRFTGKLFCYNTHQVIIMRKTKISTQRNVVVC